MKGKKEGGEIERRGKGMGGSGHLCKKPSA
jgi:hypothetical protein